MNRPFRNHVLFTLLLMFPFLFAAPLGAQNYNPNPKTIDGRLGDWGNGLHWVTPYDRLHLYDNEAQLMENTDSTFGLVPPGDVADPPINPSLVRLPPMGNGFNMVSCLAAFDPAYRGGTYWLGIDLPGQTNPNLSDGFHNQWLEFISGMIVYPMPFDVDCNEDRDVVDDGPSGSIIGSMDDHDDEFYRIYLWVGGDPSGKGASSAYMGPGFPIYINMEMSWLSPFVFEAFVPGQFTKNGIDLYLDALGLNLVTHSNPDNCSPPCYDIEVEVREVMSTVFPYIDPDKVGYPPSAPMTIADLYHAYVVFMADSNGDQSAEESLELGLDVPAFSLYADGDTLSVSTGGVINLGLFAGSGNGMRNYLVLGTLSGTSPGIALPGGLATLPINWDSFTDFIVARLNSAIFVDFYATLGPDGQAWARISAPPVSINKIGKVMHYAYLLEGPPWDFVSNAVGITFVP